jgi:hypothetical protein
MFDADQAKVLEDGVGSSGGARRSPNTARNAIGQMEGNVAIVRCASVRESGCDGVRGSWRQYQGQHGPSRGHRHADLDEDTSVRREQRAD